MQDREQQHEVGPGGPEEVELPRIDDELLGQDGHGDGRAHGAQVVDGAAEPVGLAQDGDGRGTAGGVGPGTRDGVVGRGDGAGRRRAALDLGDQVEARRGERVGDRPGCRRGRDGAGRRPARPERVELRDDVRQAPGGDLADDGSRPARLVPAAAASDGPCARRASGEQLCGEARVDGERRPVDPVARSS